VEPASEIIVRAHDGAVAQIVLDRPAALNALSTATLIAFAEACARVGADESVRAIVLSSAVGRAFCVGADLRSAPP
jgi:enoyl-CoA hydratase/carnithine racemase